MVGDSHLCRKDPQGILSPLAESLLLGGIATASLSLPLARGEEGWEGGRGAFVPIPSALCRGRHGSPSQPPGEGTPLFKVGVPFLCTLQGRTEDAWRGSVTCLWSEHQEEQSQDSASGLPDAKSRALPLTWKTQCPISFHSSVNHRFQAGHRKRKNFLFCGSVAYLLESHPGLGLAI